ncbi:MAG: hypothetical protein ACYTE8_09260 [Planctomycetota bacterium]|jgi:hypothetical protein
MIVEILKKFGPLPSDALAEKLVAQRIACSQSTARKQIQRAVKRNEIFSTSPVRFDKSFLYYLKRHEDRQYPEAVRKLLPKKPIFCRVYKMLINNKGYITSGQIGKSANAVPDGSSHTTGKRNRLNKVKEQLLKLGLINNLSGHKDIYKVGKGFGSTQVRLGVFLKFLSLEQALIKDFVNWIQNVYVIGKKSYNVRSIETGVIEFNTTCWDFKAPVFLGPCTKSTEVYSKKRQINAFSVVDIVGFRPFSEDDANALLERLKTVTLKWANIRVFPIALAMNYKRKALDILRRHGIVPLTCREVWGRNLQELLRLYKAIFSKKEQQNIDSIEKALNISNSAVKKDGILGCIKGDLFEVMTALAYRSNGYDTTLQKKITSNVTGEDFEIDVVAIKGKMECIIIECKGRNLSKEENREEIERHYDYRCKVAAETYGWNITNEYKKVEAIYITTSAESSIPSKYTSQIKNHGIMCRVMTRKEVISLFSSTDHRLAKIIKNYYQLEKIHK